MRSWLKAMLCITLSSMCLFTCVGYAALSTSLSIKGSAASEMIEGIFITKITEQATSNIDLNQFDFIPSSTNIENTLRRGQAAQSGTVEYEVTVFNNTDTTYYYRDIYYQTDIPIYNGNDYISDFQESGTVTIKCIFDDEITDAKKLGPKEKIVLRVVYTIGENISTDIDLKMLVNIRFGINVDGESEAIEAIEDRFLKILNTPSSYNYLLDVLDNKFDGYNLWTSSYIGNVAGAGAGAFSEDSVIVNTLFQNHLQITINDEPREATVIIKHEDADGYDDTGDSYVAEHPSGLTMGDRGCEMLLYLTIDPLDNEESYATVYVMVFTCDTNEATGEKLSAWYRIGNTFVGKAPVVDYVTGEYGTGSFQTTGWRADEQTYELISGYHFEIKNGDDVDIYYIDSFSYSLEQNTVMYWVLETWKPDSVPVIEHLMNDAKRIINNNSYAGEGINQLREVYEKYYNLYDKTGLLDRNEWPVNVVRKFCPAISELYGAINNALTNISNLS